MVRILYVRLGLENQSKTFLAMLPAARRASPASPVVYAETAVFVLDVGPGLVPRYFEGLANPVVARFRA